MAVEGLPYFPLHPDPLATGSVVPSADPCEVCGRSRGFLYTGPFFAVEEVTDICPWCIANGAAAAQFDGQFTDLGGQAWDVVSEEDKRLVLTRTPGFSGWQQETWFAHCGKPAVFLGRVGAGELQQYGAEAADAITSELRAFGWDDAEVADYLAHLDRDGEPTAYLFQCQACRAFLGYSDCG